MESRNLSTSVPGRSDIWPSSLGTNSVSYDIRKKYGTFTRICSILIYTWFASENNSDLTQSRHFITGGCSTSLFKWPGRMFFKAVFNIDEEGMSSIRSPAQGNWPLGCTNGGEILYHQQQLSASQERFIFTALVYSISTVEFTWHQIFNNLSCRWMSVYYLEITHNRLSQSLLRFAILLFSFNVILPLKLIHLNNVTFTCWSIYALWFPLPPPNIPTYFHLSLYAYLTQHVLLFHFNRIAVRYSFYVLFLQITYIYSSFLSTKL